MISPDVLKQSATAGFVGLAVASGVFFAASSQGDVSEARIDMTPSTETIEISFESADEMNVPCEPPTRQRAIERARTNEARRAINRARVRAAIRTLNESGASAFEDGARLDLMAKHRRLLRQRARLDNEAEQNEQAEDPSTVFWLTGD